MHFVKVLEKSCCKGNIAMQFIYIMVGLISSAAHLIYAKPYEMITMCTHQVMTDKVLYTIENTQF